MDESPFIHMGTLNPQPRTKASKPKNKNVELGASTALATFTIAPGNDKNQLKVLELRL